MLLCFGNIIIIYSRYKGNCSHFNQILDEILFRHQITKFYQLEKVIQIKKKKKKQIYKLYYQFSAFTTVRSSSNTLYVYSFSLFCVFCAYNMLLLFMDLMIFRQQNHRESYRIKTNKKSSRILCIVNNFYMIVKHYGHAFMYKFQQCEFVILSFCHFVCCSVCILTSFGSHPNWC